MTPTAQAFAVGSRGRSTNNLLQSGFFYACAASRAETSKEDSDMLQKAAYSRSDLPDLTDLLDRISEHVEELDENFAAMTGQLGDLREQLAQGRFQLAVLGQFKRGKSTLLHALLGKALHRRQKQGEAVAKEVLRLETAAADLVPLREALAQG